MSNIIKNINHLLQKHNLSQNALSKLTNIPLSTLNDNLNERTKLSSTNLETIAQVLGARIPYLMENHTLQEQFQRINLTPDSNRLHTTDNMHILILEKTDDFPNWININKPLLIAQGVYNTTDWIVTKENTHYKIELFQTPCEQIIGKLIAQLDVIN